MMNVILSNPNHLEYGEMTAPFPIPDGRYSYVLDMLAVLNIVGACKADCKMEKVNSTRTVLNRLENQMIDVNELNYLVKRLDSFDTYEAAQFSFIAKARNRHHLSPIPDL